MRGRIEVLQPGLFSTIQDTGRFGFAKFGVPGSGAMDSYAATMANLILNNNPDAAVLEMTQMGPKLKFSAPVKIVITGANLSPRINNDNIKNNKIISIAAGDVLSFGKRILGARAYLGIAGGFRTEVILQSRSWYKDLTAYSRLEKGILLDYNAGDQKVVVTASSVKTNFDYLTQNDLEVNPGPEFHKLSSEEKNGIFSKKFHVSRNNNRMGIQLEEIIPNNLQPIITGPVVAGTVQFTPGGRLIILMRDCQTTGGYPRILQLKESSINLLAQKVQGDEISFFKPVAMDRK
ncbi:biotin-dependent carboxyltransferase family protein [Antarcticibacterium flavum]|uniref:Biotin-dependent carboxyltransferase family protein n=1 Tax=Antarcticibacterium flavum TaxID=2058175 RepID=A0A5B7X0E3_9FLAO|nr:MULTISPECIES: biotin-dependent carboxyltransferase family protein [Antarcticibacterium]MCM4160219.1 allophanate hydrolase [Antarcticibacterium sp. W02-3]QCY68705.1 biotin-dependent carboxyltransferase family protein [Antarcticibacterium flavum]